MALLGNKEYMYIELEMKHVFKPHICVGANGPW